MIMHIRRTVMKFGTMMITNFLQQQNQKILAPIAKKIMGRKHNLGFPIPQPSRLQRLSTVVHNALGLEISMTQKTAGTAHRSNKPKYLKLNYQPNNLKLNEEHTTGSPRVISRIIYVTILAQETPLLRQTQHQ